MCRHLHHFLLLVQHKNVSSRATLKTVPAERRRPSELILLNSCVTIYSVGVVCPRWSHFVERTLLFLVFVSLNARGLSEPLISTNYVFKGGENDNKLYKCSTFHNNVTKCLNQEVKKG